MSASDRSSSCWEDRDGWKDGAVVLSHDGKPIVDVDTVRQYEQKKESERIH